MVTMTRSMVGVVGNSGYTLTATEELFLQVTGTTSVILGNTGGTIVEYAPTGGTIPTIKYILVQTPTNDAAQMAEWQFCENGRLIEFLLSKNVLTHAICFVFIKVWLMCMYHFSNLRLYLHNISTKIIILFFFGSKSFCIHKKDFTSGLTFKPGRDTFTQIVRLCTCWTSKIWLSLYHFFFFA